MVQEGKFGAGISLCGVGFSLPHLLSQGMNPDEQMENSEAEHPAFLPDIKALFTIFGPLVSTLMVSWPAALLQVTALAP